MQKHVEQLLTTHMAIGKSLHSMPGATSYFPKMGQVVLHFYNDIPLVVRRIEVNERENRARFLYQGDTREPYELSVSALEVQDVIVCDKLFSLV